ncbi:MAG: GIY-YIG nuclease family protein [Gemmatimonadota bacterium]
MATAGPGITPVISWKPVCRLALVFVEADDAEGPDVVRGDQWGAQPDGGNTILPPVTYGTAPPGTRNPLDRIGTLKTGHGYRLRLRRFTQPANDPGGVLAVLHFQASRE